MAEEVPDIRRFAPEIRALIFNNCVYRLWDGSTPPLLIVLRPEPKLYFEALEVFYKINTFEFNLSRHRNSFEHQSNHILAYPRELIVEARFVG
jgi:hypothetical protein